MRLALAVKNRHRGRCQLERARVGRKHEEADCFAVGLWRDAVREPRAVRAEVRWVIPRKPGAVSASLPCKAAAARSPSRHPAPVAQRMPALSSRGENDWPSAHRADSRQTWCPPRVKRLALRTPPERPPAPNSKK